MKARKSSVCLIGQSFLITNYLSLINNLGAPSFLPELLPYNPKGLLVTGQVSNKLALSPRLQVRTCFCLSRKGLSEGLKGQQLPLTWGLRVNPLGVNSIARSFNTVCTGNTILNKQLSYFLKNYKSNQIQECPSQSNHLPGDLVLTSNPFNRKRLRAITGNVSYLGSLLRKKHFNKNASKLNKINYFFLQTILSKYIETSTDPSKSRVYPEPRTGLLLKEAATGRMGAKAVLIPGNPVGYNTRSPLSLEPNGFLRKGQSLMGQPINRLTFSETLSLNIKGIKKNNFIVPGLSTIKNNQYFLLSNINNKSFLCYWLIPVVGFTVITYKHSVNPSERLASFSLINPVDEITTSQNSQGKDQPLTEQPSSALTLNPRFSVNVSTLKDMAISHNPQGLEKISHNLKGPTISGFFDFGTKNFYFNQKIAPLGSKTVINNNLNFIKIGNSLKGTDKLGVRNADSSFLENLPLPQRGYKLTRGKGLPGITPKGLSAFPFGVASPGIPGYRLLITNLGAPSFLPELLPYNTKGLLGFNPSYRNFVPILATGQVSNKLPIVEADPFYLLKFKLLKLNVTSTYSLPTPERLPQVTRSLMHKVHTSPVGAWIGQEHSSNSQQVTTKGYKENLEAVTKGPDITQKQSKNNLQYYHDAFTILNNINKKTDYFKSLKTSTNVHNLPGIFYLPGCYAKTPFGVGPVYQVSKELPTYMLLRPHNVTNSSLTLNSRLVVSPRRGLKTNVSLTPVSTAVPLVKSNPISKDKGILQKALRGLISPTIQRNALYYIIQKTSSSTPSSQVTNGNDWRFSFFQASPVIPYHRINNLFSLESASAIPYKESLKGVIHPLSRKGEGYLPVTYLGRPNPYEASMHFVHKGQPGKRLTSDLFQYINKKIKQFITSSSSLGQSKLSVLKDSPLTIGARGWLLKRQGDKEKRQKQTINSINSVSMVFKHNKMFKKNKYLKNDTNYLGSDSYREKSSNKIKLILKNRLYLQKKRKAKKQRLETRRQKKRTRFFPRPAWIRFRLFSNFLKKRNNNSSFLGFFNITKTNKHLFLKGGTSDNQVSPLVSPFLGISSNPFKSDLLSTLWVDPNILGVKKFIPKNIKNFAQGQYFLRGSKVTAASYNKNGWMSKKEIKLVFKDYWLKNKGIPLKDPKVKGNLVNFKEQKQDNQPNQNYTKSGSTILRDFWVWFYNATANVKYTGYLSPVEGMRYWLLAHNSNSTLWALNKTFNKYSFTQYNKRFNLWGLQKKRNQSKNNQTIKISKQLLMYWDRFFINKKLNLFNKKMYSKMRHSLRKVNYLNGFTGISTIYSDYPARGKEFRLPGMPGLATYNPLGYQKADSCYATIPGSTLPLYPQGVANRGLQINKYYLVESAPWWADLQVKQKATHSIPHFHADGLKAGGPHESLTFWGKEFLLNRQQAITSPLIIGSAVLFHFCAIISLVSISQLRCFIKFHLILIYKLSNIYSSLLTKIGRLVSYNFLYVGAIHKPFNITTPPYPQGVRGNKLLGQGLKQVGQPLYRQRVTWDATAPRLVADRGKPIVTTSQPQVIRLGLSQQKQRSSSLTNITSNNLLSYKQAKLTPFFKKQFIRIYQPQTRVFNQNLNTLLNSSPNIESYLGLPLVTGQKTDNSLFSTNNSLAPLRGNLLQIGTSNPFGVNRSTSKNNVSYTLKRGKLLIKKESNNIKFVTKNVLLKSLFNVIDLFQYTLKSIYAFFEKPAEFATTWVASGFLFEWSSDFLTIIPENLDIYIWNTFSKMSRTVALSSLTLTPGINQYTTATTILGLSSLITPKGLFTTLPGEGVKGPVNPIRGEAILSLLSISLLLQRRISYLFDFFVKTLNQPDSDLIRRQQKGTLFWDIWADFLVTAADQYNVNIAALSTIKAEQNNLIDNISNSANAVSFKTAKRADIKPIMHEVHTSPVGAWTVNTNKVFISNLKAPLVAALKEADKVPTKAKWRVLKEQKTFSNQSAPLFTYRGNRAINDLSTTYKRSSLNQRGSDRIPAGGAVLVESFNYLPLQIKHNSPSQWLAKLASNKERDFKKQNAFSLFNGLIAWNDLAQQNRWSVNQFITYQSWQNNSDLFIDYHPPKTFTHIPNIKYNNMLQQPIGTLVCQIYSGIFTKQISKNILLVNNKNVTGSVTPFNTESALITASPIGPSPNTKGMTNNQNQIISKTDYNTLLIQALAGETELKIITDNAKRYALVNRGFAIGIKLLRDVFDKIKFNTPCIFLLEDIDAIGERRPMLISDYGGEDNKNNSEFFMNQRDEVHEKNQVIYQNFFHAITHYKKPFKGDYSLAIPTNKYLTDLYKYIRIQSTNNYSLTVNNNATIKPILSNQNSQLTKGAPNDTVNNPKGLLVNKQNTWFKTHLQIKQQQNQLTSPNSSDSMMLKADKGNSTSAVNNAGGVITGNKIPEVVQEYPWIGFPVEQLSTKPRISYSIRAKVAMLAEFSLSNLSAKLDMITDLLVIIDSVRGNRGFVVFATTDVPQILDPALRRPGRLDETICMPNINKTMLNVPLIKNNHNKLTIDITLTEKFNNALLSKSKLLLKKVNMNYAYPLPFTSKGFLGFIGTEFRLPALRAGNPSATLQGDIIPRDTIEVNTGLTYVDNPKGVISRKLALASQITLKGNKGSSSDMRYTNSQALMHEVHTSPYGAWTSPVITGNNILLRDQISKEFSKLKSSVYYEAGKAILNLKIQNSKTPNALNNPFQAPTGLVCTSCIRDKTNINYLAMYGDYLHLIQELMILFGGKTGQFLSTASIKKEIITTKKVGATQLSLSDFRKLKCQKDQTLVHFNDVNKNDLQSATSLIKTFIQKRYLSQKNLIVPKLLSFVDGTVLDEPPSPPFSSLLIPAKRFENYKRVLRDSIFSENMGLYTNRKPYDYSEKIQSYVQLSSIKKLKVNQGTGNRILDGDKITHEMHTSPVGAWQIGKLYGLKSLQTSTNINWYYQNRILKRHKDYLTNQWWNGQLSEHNAETVFLSDIDWRSSFTPKINKVPLKKTAHVNSDVLLDFPDADQHYNPRRRRWLLQKGYWSFWFNFDQIYYEQIINHLVFESINKTYTYLHNNSELLDHITSKFLSLGYQTNPYNLGLLVWDSEPVKNRI